MMSKKRLVGKSSSDVKVPESILESQQYLTPELPSEFKVELDKFLNSEKLINDAPKLGAGKKYELARRSLSIMGGNDLTPTANRALKEMSDILSINPNLITSVPEPNIKLVLEFMKQNKNDIYLYLTDIWNKANKKKKSHAKDFDKEDV